MSLTDPTTPAGFFHLRLVPGKLRLLAEGRSLFPKGPEPGRDTYFEEPLRQGGGGLEQDPALLTPAGVLGRLRDSWASAGESLLIELGQPLEELRKGLARGGGPEGDEEISDFVYPLF